MSAKASKKQQAASAASPMASSAQATQATSTPKEASTTNSQPQQQQQQQPPRPGSPLSPTRHSRLQEKHDLQNLNDRLACYIDRVRYLETENTRLTREMSSVQETSTREVTNLKSVYDHELCEARKCLDEVHREKSKLEMDIKRLFEETEEQKALLARKSKDLLMAENSVRVLDTRCNDFQYKAQQAQQDAQKALAELRDVEKERDKLKKQLEDLKRHLEDESLARIDCENNNQTLREELNFKDQIFQQQLSETRMRRQVDISEIDGRLSEQYEAKMQEALQDLRDQYEAQMAMNREEIEALYEAKIKNLQSAANRNTGAASHAIDELRHIRGRIDGYNIRITELEGANAGLHSRNRELEQLLETERLRHAEDLATLERELTRLREEMATQLQEYQDLMDIKVSLDLEIAAYRKLLESEEARLNITPNVVTDVTSSTTNARSMRSSSQRRTPMRTAAAAASAHSGSISGSISGSLGKRKRTLLEESQESSLSDYSINAVCKGDVEIAEVCPDGKYIRLHNKSDKEVGLSGWQLVRKTGEDTSTYKFSRAAKVDAKGYVTVWSVDSGHDHEPPMHLVMKSQRWFVSDNMVTKLMNPDNVEVASSERVRRQLSSSSSRHREYAGYLGSEDLHHQQGDPQGDEKCSIM